MPTEPKATKAQLIAEYCGDEPSDNYLWSKWDANRKWASKQTRDTLLHHIEQRDAQEAYVEALHAEAVKQSPAVEAVASEAGAKWRSALVAHMVECGHPRFSVLPDWTRAEAVTQATIRLAQRIVVAPKITI